MEANERVLHEMDTRKTRWKFARAEGRFDVIRDFRGSLVCVVVEICDLITTFHIAVCFQSGVVELISRAEV